MNNTRESVRTLSVERGKLVPLTVVKRRSFKQTAQRLLFFLILISIGGIIGYLIGENIDSLIFLDQGPLGIVWLVLTILLGLYIVTLVHECGHLVGGRLVGSRFILLIVGPLQVIRERDGVHVRLNKNLGAYGGLAASMPQGERDIARKLLVTVAGGPVASLALTVVAAGIAFWPGLMSALAAQMFVLLAALSGAIFLATVIPAYTAGFFTDGARILMLLKGGERAERWSASVLLNNQMLVGALPREWNPVWLQKVISLADGTLDEVLGYTFAYYHALDTGDVAGAQRFLESQLAMLDRLPALIRPNIALEAAYFEAHYHDNVEAARDWQKQAKGGIIDRCTRLRVEASILLAEGKREEAHARIQEGLESVKDAMYASTGRMEEIWLKELLER